MIIKGEIAVRIHRVGTITLGTMLIAFGILFLSRLFFETINYEFILRLWPFVLISLGCEILYANLKSTYKSNNFIYDKTAFFLVIVLSFFAIAMATAESFINYTKINMIYF